ncbi:hypothetical protein T439DRAFT_382036 [Meredithblackwellia eburnea MCA 4105]
MAGSTPGSSKASKGKKVPLQNRSISEFFSPISSPKTVAGSSSPAPQPRPAASRSISRSSSLAGASSPSSAPPKQLKSTSSSSSVSSAPNLSQHRSSSQSSAPSVHSSTIPPLPVPPVLAAAFPSSTVSPPPPKTVTISEPFRDKSSESNMATAPLLTTASPKGKERAIPRSPTPAIITISSTPTNAQGAAATPTSELDVGQDTSPILGAASDPDKMDVDVDDQDLNAPDSDEVVASALLQTSLSPAKSVSSLAAPINSPTISRTLPAVGDNSFEAMERAETPEPVASTSKATLENTSPIYSTPRKDSMTKADVREISPTSEAYSSPLSSLPPSPHRPRGKFIGVFVHPDPKKRLPASMGGTTRIMRRERSVTTAILDSPGKGKAKEVAEEYNNPFKVPDWLAGTGGYSDDEDESDVVEDSEDEESENKAMELLAQARARMRVAKEEGITLPAYQPRASASGVAVGGGAGRSVSPEVRKSSRVPGASKAEKEKEREEQRQQREEREQSLAALGGGKGKHSILQLQKDKAKRNENRDMIEATRQMLNAETDDLLDSDNGFSSDEEITVKKEAKTFNTAKARELLHVASNAIVDEYAKSPEKRQAKETFAPLANILEEERQRASTAAASPALLLGELERLMWIQGVKVAPFAVAEETEGWNGKLVSAIRDGLVTPSSFPTPTVFLSSLSDCGTSQEQVRASRLLFDLISHPFTDALLAERASLLLNRFVAQYDSSSPLITGDHFLQAFGVLGVRSSTGRSTSRLMEHDEEVDLEEILPNQRRLASIRILRVMSSLLATRSRSSRPTFATTDCSSLAVFLARLCLDPEAAPLRSHLEQTLRDLLHSMDWSMVGPIRPGNQVTPTGVKIRRQILDQLIASFHPMHPRVQLELVRCLPHGTPGSRILRRWLSWMFLLPETEAKELAGSNAAFYGPPQLANIITYLSSFADPAHPFFFSERADFVSLLYRAELLSITLSDLDQELFASADASENAKHVEDIIGLLMHIEGLTKGKGAKSGLDATRSKAKNALVRVQHSLIYQRNYVTGNTAATAYLEGPSNGDESNSGKRRKLENGQQPLNFAASAPVVKSS